ncbi:LysR family transcriptional regulator [Allobaculum sp. JKK-2023]|uniref:LysR substrate-binding domain-containing protein n=1 Tax=Allobaculum sp. JKK-2023 TaxID=3108943 RepID=UPI002B0596BA|nr:LysR family transcriptional regulator [Allobaculum sp. JKK-2023]
MIDLRLWEVLVAFDQEGTLQKAADFLHISQPAISQSLRRLESELGVPLCIRAHRNRVVLNETGLQAAKEARALLEKAQQLEDQIRTLQTIQIGTCAPLPEWQLEKTIRHQFGSRAHFVLKDDPEELLEDLKSGQDFLVILGNPVDNPDLYGHYLTTETLDLAVPQNHPLAAKEKILLKDLAGQNLLLYKKIGCWNRLVQEKLPNTHFLSIDNRPTFTSAAILGAFPYFISQSFVDTNPTVTARPLEGMQMDFYLVCLKDNIQARHLIQNICQNKQDKELFDFFRVDQPFES